MLYLTGFDEPNYVLVLKKDINGNCEEVMFVEDNDEHSLLWSGPRSGTTATREHFGLQKAFPFQEFGKFLSSSIQGNVLYADFDENSCLSTDLVQLLEKGNAQPIKSDVYRDRLFKSATEQVVMREAGRIGSEAFRETIKWSRGRRFEAELAAKMEFEVKMRGATGLAYVPVVAGGDRANIIHYVRNDRIVDEGTMILMDAGAKVHGYCNDITRTWPISGRFTAPQKELYEAVLRVQKRCIQAAGKYGQFPDLTLNALNHIAMVLFVDELGTLGFRTPEKAVCQLFPHSIGHYLGLDLHDCPAISCEEPLKDGMVITIEPGLYVPALSDYPTRFHGIGVRIEDDILLDADGAHILTEGVPREVEEIEHLMNT